jgi:hypothetical protein
MVVEGPVDRDYLDTLRLLCVPLLRVAFGFRDTQIHAVAVEPRERDAIADSGRQALLFSGGVDSLYSLARLRQLGHPRPLLVNINAGAHGDQRAHFQSRLLRIASLAQATGLELLSIDTNFHEVVEIGHQYGHPFRTIAAAYTAYGAIGRLFLSTARAYQELSFDFVTWSMEAPGATVSNSVVWDRVPLTEIGYDRTRYEKVTTIAEEPLSYRALDVCVDPERAAAKARAPVNCGECFKCSQTLLELELAGCLDRYGTQFDLESYRANRHSVIEKLRARGGPGNAYLLARLDGANPSPPAALDVTTPDWASQDEVPHGASKETRSRSPRLKARRPPVRLFWSTNHWANESNVGDELSPAIVRMVSGRDVQWSPPEACDIAAIGSIIEMVLSVPRHTPTVIWGSGFIGDGPALHHAPLLTTALRGPDSAARLGRDGDVPLGDPGLLAGRLLDRSPGKSRSVGLVPHFAELDLPILDPWVSEPGSIISPRLPIADFLGAVASCELILSSSLHGLIIADSLGIPNVWVRLSDRVIGSGFKFRDYFHAVRRQGEWIRLPSPGSMTQGYIDELASTYRTIDVDNVTERLIGAFPDV